MNAKFLAGMIAIMTLGGVSATSANAKSSGNVTKDDGSQDSRIIVEVNKDLANLSKEEIHSSQDEVMRSISKKVTKNFELVDRFDVLNNAFVMKVNNENIDAIRNLPEVKSVTVDKIHAKKDISDGDYYSADLRGFKSSVEEPGVEFPNYSAETMNKPSGTNEGEGTVIAILDNEFYLRGVHEASTDDKGNYDDGHAWNHDVFKPLDESIIKRFTYDNLTPIVTNKANPTHAKRKDGTNPGDEGSLYYNNKVPFYYDYGGESSSYGKIGKMDYDVTSLITYHGSHVASIASANADKYKGIAPNAQLACMKVFTNYKANETDKQMGFSDSSGAYDSVILMALEDCISLGVDGINMSLGSDLDDFDRNSITMKTLSSLAADSGILTAISAGNAGKMSYSFAGGYGNWTTDMVETGILGSYANSAESTIVASGQPTQIYFETAIKSAGKNIAYEDQIVNREGQPEDFPADKQFKLTDLIPVHGGEIGWVYVPGFGTAADYEGLDVKGKVAVVNRGSTNFADKYNIAKGKGAIAIIIINNDPTENEFTFRCSFGDGFQPSMPCALVLFKDKPIFESQRTGVFTYISKEASENDAVRTISSFSSDGAKFNYDLKPDITTPGESIRGAIPPQKKEHREETPLSTYEFLSGTSMAAPNYAGAQSLLLSKVAKSLAEGGLTDEEKKELVDYRKTIDMRLMSTANPMRDFLANGEDGNKNYTSPRMQGAGMVDLGKAYSTDIYLEGMDLLGNPIGKSKICLGNSEDIAKGKLNLSFIAHNEGAEQTFDAKVTIMRPAVVEENNVIPDEFNYTGEISEVTEVPGLTYYAEEFKPGQGTVVVKKVNPATSNYKDVIKATRDIEYYISEADFKNKTNVQVLPKGYLLNTAETGCKWEVLPSAYYQSIQDYVIDEVVLPNAVTIASGKSTINLDVIELSKEAKDEILKYYPYGCAIEGFVELQQSEVTKLSMPFLGFYSGADDDTRETTTLEEAPVVEPFTFEKDINKIYPSDLINDTARTLVGKDKAEFGSTWTFGYAESPEKINTEKVLTNELNFEIMPDWHKAGVNPEDDSYFDDPANNIYVGNPNTSNTMIIQQFVMRSVKDNFFTIKDADGKVVYKSVLEDSLYGDKQLHKSHVDGSYLSAGYIASRAWAIIPLYDVVSGKAFADGTYEIEFNYQLSYNDAWVKKAYNFTIDATAPVITSIVEYNDAQGTPRVRFEIADQKVSKASLGLGLVDVYYDEDKKAYYIDETKEDIDAAIQELGTLSNGQRRLTISITDAAYGVSGAIIHFFGSTHSNYVIAQGYGLITNQDFIKVGKDIKWYQIKGSQETEFEQKNFITVYTKIAKWEDPIPEHVHTFAEAWTTSETDHWHAATCGHDVKDSLGAHVDENKDEKCDICGYNLHHENPDPKPDPTPDPEKKDNLPLIIGLSVGGGALVLGGAGVAVFFLLRRKKLGGK